MTFKLEGLLGRVTPGWQNLNDQDKSAIARQGLLASGLAMLRARNGGNFGASLADGLSSGLLAVNQGIADTENTRYKNEILARTRQGMERNTAIEQAQRGVLNPDGSLNEDSWSQWANVDPVGAQEFRQKASPRAKWEPGQIGYRDPKTGESGLLDVLRNTETQEYRDLQGNVISKGLLGQVPAHPQMPNSGLLAPSRAAEPRPSSGLLAPAPLGQFGAGNIDLTKRPRVKNSDGSVSTVLSFSTNIDGREVLLPLVSDDGRIVSEEEAIKSYLANGKYLGVFDTPEEADAYAERLHREQESMYVPPKGGLLGADMLPGLEQSVMQVESGGNPSAVSPKGAMGTMQTMPSTLTDPGYGVAPARDRSPAEMERVGKDYLQAMLTQYGDPRLALAAYNWGPGNVDRAMQTHGGNVDAVLANAPAETRAYVPKVLAGVQGGQGASQIGRRPAKAGSQRESYRTLNKDEVASYGLPVGTVAQIGPTGQIQIINKPRDTPAGGAGQVIDNGDGSTTYIPAGKTSEGERNASGFFSRMVESNKEMQRLEAAGYDPTNRRDYYMAGGEILNPLATDEGQQYRQAQNNWVRANLRKESGAAIGKDEMEQERRTYFPIPGDSPGVIEQKARARQVTERAMRSAAGSALPVPAGRAAGAVKGGSNVPPAAVEYLRKNPAMRSAFEQKYGVSADDYLR